MYKIEYDIYIINHLKKFRKINNTVHKGTKISLLISIISNENIDVLDISNDYYNNICSIAGSNKSLDVSLKKRKKEFIEENKTI